MHSYQFRPNHLVGCIMLSQPAVCNFRSPVAAYMMTDTSADTVEHTVPVKLAKKFFFTYFNR